MKEEQKKTFNINIFVLVISIVLIAISIYIKSAHFLRPILIVLAIILIALNVGISNKLKKTTTISFIITLIIIFLVIDGVIVIVFNRIPIFAYNIISTENTRVYNSIGVRVWQCDKNDFDNLIVDPFYKKGYMCNAKDIDVIDSNSFLNSIVTNYNQYKNMYVKIKGKISKKTGQNYIEMRPYENSDITINGYVNFADNITLRVIFNNNEAVLDEYDVYDEITIVGIVKNLENEANKYVVYMSDSKVVSNINLNEYVLTATTEKKCTKTKQLIYTNDTSNVYSYCLEEIIVSYPDNKYELSAALSSNKISIEKLYDDPNKVESYEDDNRKIYRFDDYSILVCDQLLSKDIVIGNKKMSFKDIECQPKVEE